MPKIIPNNLRSHIASQFVESFDEAANTIYYLVAARSYPFEDDNNPPANTNIRAIYYDLHDEMIFGKNITSADVVHMIKDRRWTANTVYDRYDDLDDNLENKNFFVVSVEGINYNVFKCLDNNNGVPSTDQPLKSETAANDEYYQTSDGYVWKFMFTVTDTDYNKFATGGYLPVFADANVQGNAVSGSIDAFTVITGGKDYNSYANGTFKNISVNGNNLLHSIQSDSSNLSSNTDFYRDSAFYISSGTGAGQLRRIVQYAVTGNDRNVVIDSPFTTTPDFTSVFDIVPYVEIDGDGQGAVALSKINTTANSISNIEVINRGSGYSFANITVVGNTGTVNGAANSAEVRAIVAPKGGHGSDVVNELFSDKIGLSVVFDGDEANTIPVDNDYRKVAILKEPRFTNLELTLSVSALNFTQGESVVQANTGASGTVTDRDSLVLTLTDVRGFFETGNSTVNYITGQTSNATAEVSSVSKDFRTFDQRHKFTVEVTYNGAQGTGFVKDERVTQDGTDAEGYVHSIGANTIHLVGIKGAFEVSNDIQGITRTFVGETSGAIAKILSKQEPDLLDDSGEFIYIESMQPITRDAAQKETVKLIIEF